MLNNKYLDLKNVNNYDDIDIPAKVIEDGGLVLFPTETVYGIGANGFDDDAVKKIFIAKGRAQDNPLILHIANFEMLDEIAENISELEYKLMDAFWPGPFTIILNKKKGIANEATCGGNTVGVRMPSNRIAYELIKRAGVPIAAPSANISGKPSPTTPKYVIDDMMGRIDAIIEGGDCQVGVESTIIDLSGDVPVILRPGGITYQEIKKHLPDVIIDKHILKSVEKDERPKCPGMKYKHYAPDADVTVVEGSSEKIRLKINELLSEKEKLKTGVITYGVNEYNADLVISAGKDNKEYAKNLFRVLREFDDACIDVVFAEFCSDDGYGLAVKNRLYKSAGNKVIMV